MRIVNAQVDREEENERISVGMQSRKRGDRLKCTHPCRHVVPCGRTAIGLADLRIMHREGIPVSANTWVNVAMRNRQEVLARKIASRREW